MKNALLTLISLSALFSAGAFASNADQMQIHVLPMGAYTRISVSDNGQILKNAPVTLKNNGLVEQYRTNNDGAVYISNLSHGNKHYTIQSTAPDGQVATTTALFPKSASNS
ncbi:hypothetical protein M9194_15675 [Vibrio sp. S4M6]|uniref:hypothetical protein n=1 Tax=Vibrio sinus TaxID=2946865 RepID=UPI00202A2491|nr:hypothetical protein [Vibrio sinus]MCL9782872.1 hypothetical protein [Vibrio sinus]